MKRTLRVLIAAACLAGAANATVTVNYLVVDVNTGDLHVVKGFADDDDDIADYTGILANWGLRVITYELEP